MSDDNCTVWLADWYKKYHPLVQNIEVHVVLGQELDMAQGSTGFTVRSCYLTWVLGG